MFVLRVHLNTDEFRNESQAMDSGVRTHQGSYKRDSENNVADGAGDKPYDDLRAEFGDFLRGGEQRDDQRGRKSAAWAVVSRQSRV